MTADAAAVLARLPARQRAATPVASVQQSGL